MRLTQITRGRLISSAYCHTFSVTTSTPETPSTTTRAASAADMAILASCANMVKPGESNRLILVLCHSSEAMEVEIVIWRARQMTISTSIASLEWHNTKINLFDSPGFTMFAHEAKIAMSAAEAALVVVDGVSGVEVVTEKVWQYAEEINLPRVICVSRMDRERANYEMALDSLVTAF